MPTPKGKKKRRRRKKKKTIETLSFDHDPGYDAADDHSTPRRRVVLRAKERVKMTDIEDYQKLAALPRPSMPGDPPTIKGTRVGRFRLDLHDYEQWQGDVADRVTVLGENALQHRTRTGDAPTDDKTADRVLSMGKQAFTLTKAVAYDTRSKAAAMQARASLAEAGLMTPLPVSRGKGSRGSSAGGSLDLVLSLAPPGRQDAPDLLDLSDYDDDEGKYSKRRRSNVAVIIVRIVFISSFLFYFLLLNHSFQTNPNKITNCFQLFLSIQLTTTLLLRRYFDLKMQTVQEVISIN